MSENIRPLTKHQFVSINNIKLVSIKMVGLLHYYCYSYSDFINKYRNYRDLPDTYQSGQPVKLQKRLWRDMVNGGKISEACLRKYYEQWILFKERDIWELQNGKFLGIFPKPQALVEVDSVKQVFRELLNIKPPKV